MLVHNPAQMPTSANAKLGITHSSLDWLLLYPKRLRTSADIKDWSPSRRGCYFDHERSLHFFDIYTQANCDLECESNYSLSICGCVPYYHPSWYSRTRARTYTLTYRGGTAKHSSQKLISLTILTLCGASFFSFFSRSVVHADLQLQKNVGLRRGCAE